MRRLLVIGLVLFSSHAYAGDPWDRTDKVLGVGAATMLMIDWGQTRYIAKHPERYTETNRILGEHPSVGSVNNYFLAVGIGSYFLANALPSEYRKAMLAGAIAVDIYYTKRNRGLGIKVEF